MDRQAIVVCGPMGSGAATLACEVAQRIGGVRRKCAWSEFVAPVLPRVLRMQSSVLIVDGLPDSDLARERAVERMGAVDPQLIFVARSASAFASHPAFAVVEVERKPTVDRKRPVCHAPQIQPRDRAGVASAFELTLRFIAWANGLQAEPTAEQIRKRWDLSRATSYRWLRAWQDAKGALSA